MFDAPVMQNNLRGIYVEAMVVDLLGEGWRAAGADWAAWDIEHVDTGLRVEVKQSARVQSWGDSRTAPGFSIRVAKGHYPDGVTFIENTSGKHLADIYVFAWHDGDDQRAADQWE